jgi:predicted NUDIX family NTP pyrophosphohydrolase
MPKKSAGLLLYRGTRASLEVFLVHPGGPFWANKDDGAWSIPKGELGPGEDPLNAAKREFAEETGLVAKGVYQPLRSVRQTGGKVVYAWSVQCNIDTPAVKSNTFSIEWPPGSGKVREFPEIDRAEWFKISLAKRKILKSQLGLLEQLAGLIAVR